MASFKHAPNRAPPPPPPLHIFPGDDYRSKPFYSTIPEDIDGSHSPPAFSAESLMATSPSSPEALTFSDYSPTNTSSGSSGSSIARSLSNVLRMPTKASPPKAFPEKAEPVRLVNPEEEYRDTAQSLTKSPVNITTKRTSTAASTALPTPTIQPYTADEEDLDEPEEEEEQEAPELPPLILITGATSGLGLAFFQHFAARDPSNPSVAPYDVLGVDKVPWRLPGKGFQWQARIGASGQFVQLDFATASSKRLASFAKTYLSTTVTTPPRRRGGQATKKFYPRPITLVVHCATADSEGGSADEDTNALGAIDPDALRRTFDAHVLSTVQLTQTLLPNLRLEAARVAERREDVTAAFGDNTDWLDQLRVQGSRASLVQLREDTAPPLPPLDPPPRVVVMGSRRWGSVGGNLGGGGYAYRASKAAVNAVVKSLSVDVAEVCFACVSPGTEEVAVGVANGKKESETKEDGVSHEDIVTELLPLFEKLGKGRLESGCFVDRFGDGIKW